MTGKEALNDLWDHCVNWKDNPAKKYYSLINQDLDFLEELLFCFKEDILEVS